MIGRSIRRWRNRHWRLIDRLCRPFRRAADRLEARRIRLANRAARQRGWTFDGDGWLRRPYDAARDHNPYRFGSSCHAFVDGGYLYCRDGLQARVLDDGGMV